MMRPLMAFDASASKRWTDDNGFLHVASSHVTKEQVAPYYGREIPGWDEEGLDPEKIYWGYRPAEELAKAAPTINGLPILWEHHDEDASRPQIEHRIGSMGTDGTFRAPYLDNSLVFTVQEYIDKITDEGIRELSLSYRYDPKFTSGTFEGQPYDFVMRNIRGNHLAVVEQGRAGPDVIVADAAPVSIKKRQPNEGIMGKFRKLFRGARDDNPEIERQEVDLAQAIIDLHKVDPATGEIVDIAEDEDKAAEIRKLVGEFAGKLDPAEIEKLTSALTDLAYSKATGEEDKAKDDAEEEKNFAEGVKYGERLERDPEERRKLDREHEAEGMRRAMDKCGLDADSEEAQRAFAEGVKYGEELIRNPEERRKLDREHESEGARKAEDEDDMVEKAVGKASDSALRRMQAIMDAQAEVRPYVGELKVRLASDSADTVYGAALEAMGIPLAGHPRAAYRSLFRLASQQRQQVSGLASDAAPARGALAGLNKIKKLF